MKASEKNIDEIFTFEGSWGVESRCGLRRAVRGDRTVVIVTELYQDNPGSSVTSVSTSLAGQICSRYGIDPRTMIYIESAPAMNSKLSFYDEEYYRVDFDIDDTTGGVTLASPRWTKLDAQQIKEYVF